MMRTSFATVSGLLLLCAGTLAQEMIVMPDSTSGLLVGFNPVDGSLKNANIFSAGTGLPFSAIEVNNEVWVSYQTGDRVVRFSKSGAQLGEMNTELDNIRGMTLIGGTVYLTNEGVANGAPGPAIVLFDTSGTRLGHFSTSVGARSPFAVLDFQSSLLVASSFPNNDIHRYQYDGTSIGSFYNGTLSFMQQMALDVHGDVWAAAFTSNAVAKLSPAGVELERFTLTGARGVYVLQNGNLLVSNASGAFVRDLAARTTTRVYAGAGRHFSKINFPARSMSGTVRFGGRTAGFTPDVTIDFRDPTTFASIGSALVSLTGTAEPDLFTYEIPTSSLPQVGSFVPSLQWTPFLRRNLPATSLGGNLSGQDFVLVIGDINGDNRVDIDDFLVMASTYEVSPPTSPEADLTGDGNVDIDDFLLLAGTYETVGDPPL